MYGYIIMYLKIKKASLIPDKFGNSITITMVGLYQDDGKWVKWVKLNEKTLELLINQNIHCDGNS